MKIVIPGGSGLLRILARIFHARIFHIGADHVVVLRGTRQAPSVLWNGRTFDGTVW
jgi:hypothetical protein